ncbi:hypothetical protein WP50_22610 [Lactiplantibacillus plantarum]|nr:hypothetical protein WP50_22610 [Lactiplantibacillus plantarum]
MQLAITVANERYLATDQPLTNQAIQFLQQVVLQPLVADGQFDQATFDRQKKNLEAAIMSVADDKQYYAAQQLKCCVWCGC